MARLRVEVKMTQSSAMPHVNAGYVQMMARYNAEMNRRTLAAVQRLSDEDRRKQRGAFWGSIHGTLCHLLWADQMWMFRFDGWAKPSVAQKDSSKLIESIDELREVRIKTDTGISEWAARVNDGWLQQHQSWFSMSAGREMHSPRVVLVAHFFNHQTHHRGQAHAMITAAGEQTGDTDLFLLV
jgi:uncharacterized damage-inducible protein DinB